jgi:hypothetical protein
MFMSLTFYRFLKNVPEFGKTFINWKSSIDLKRSRVFLKKSARLKKCSNSWKHICEVCKNVHRVQKIICEFLKSSRVLTMFAWMPRSRPSMSTWPASTPTQGICMRRPSRTTTTSPQRVCPAAAVRQPREALQRLCCPRGISPLWPRSRTRVHRLREAYERQQGAAERWMASVVSGIIVNKCDDHSYNENHMANTS